MESSEQEFERIQAEKQKKVTASKEGIEIIDNRSVPTPQEQAKAAAAVPYVDQKQLAKLMRAVNMGKVGNKGAGAKYQSKVQQKRWDKVEREKGKIIQAKMEE